MKAILIVDIPDDYDEYGNGDWYIIGDDLRIVYEEDGALTHYKFIDYDIAHLKPLSQHMTMKNVVDSDYNEAFIDGFNYCIDEITGEKE